MADYSIPFIGSFISIDFQPCFVSGLYAGVLFYLIAGCVVRVFLCINI